MMRKNILTVSALPILVFALSLAFGEGSAGAGSELGKSDVDNYVEVLHAGDGKNRSEVLLELMSKNSESLDDVLKKITIITFASGRLRAGETAADVLSSLKAEFPEWKVTPADVELVENRKDDVIEVTRLLVDELFPKTPVAASGAEIKDRSVFPTRADVDNYILVFSEADHRKREEIEKNLAAEGVRDLEEFFETASLLAFVGDLFAIGESDETVMKLLEKEYPDMELTESDFDAVLERKDELARVTGSLNEEVLKRLADASGGAGEFGPSALTEEDLDNFVKVFSVENHFERGKIVEELMSGGVYGMDDLVDKTGLIVFIAALLSLGETDEFVIGELREEFPEITVTERDIGIVKERKDEIIEITSARMRTPG
ncbi:MAG: hypothetical protein LBF41_08490 [Deltaproteobacteria bacterium]|nr:hypothetical protein [Deltaproteobacteria bacterium]